ncbi:BQ5605_C013g07249 [Microbotryum silenes-dioicae]|uniref:BQ5605_C013g07249 protein n=1 Tax=Microbotryum silenes-dioicae TaxID=796604 RepID=A0A2X0LVW7_9BASI|nr:BQ5605_C013g07249 [Microbotryum silenes-dioicae]
MPTLYALLPSSAQEIKRINAKQLDLGEGGSWHDQYKDSAYIYVGVDISMPRDPTTQKPRGFAFLMYADQRSTVLAVDNLGGAKVLERTLRVDHVLNYKQLERDEETGKMKEREQQRSVYETDAFYAFCSASFGGWGADELRSMRLYSLAAHPDRHWAPPKADTDDEAPSDSDSSHPSIDPDDPMRDYLIQQARAKGKKSSKSLKSKHGGESKEERRKRREEKRRIKDERARRKEGKRRGEDTSTGRSETEKRERRDDGGRRERRIEEGHRSSREEDERRRAEPYSDRDRDRERRAGRARDVHDERSRRRTDDDRERERGAYDDRRRRRESDDEDDAYRRRRDGPSRSSAFADLEKAVGMR